MRYLIVYCGHGDSTSANGVCVWNLANELKRRGHVVHVIWQQKDIQQEKFDKNGIHCYVVAESWYYSLTQWHKTQHSFLMDILYKLVSLIRMCYVLPVYPNISPAVAYKCCRLTNRIIQKEDINRVIGIYQPYHAIATTLFLKKEYREKLFVANYHLDLVSSPINTNKFIRKYKLWKGNKAVKKELGLIDLMLLPMSGKGLIESEKIAYVDFPLFVKDMSGAQCEFKYPQDSINITYVGSLDANNRNPSYIVSLIDECNTVSGKKVVLHVWGNLADKETQEIIERATNVQYHGLLENQYVQDILSRSDCLLNVSNAVTFDMIPSKIFQLFSMHKPIVNIVRNEKDCSLAYFEKYPNVINIREYSHSKNDAQGLNDFLSSINKKPVVYNDDLYIESTPEYICDIIDKK